MIFVGEIEERLLHPSVVLGGALEVLQCQLVGGVQAKLARDQPPLSEVRLVPQEDPEQSGGGMKQPPLPTELSYKLIITTSISLKLNGNVVGDNLQVQIST